MMNGSLEMQKDIQGLKTIVDDLRDAVDLLETEKDNLRQAVRKLKAENARTKEKLKKLSSHLKTSGVDIGSDGDDEFPEYDDIGRNFILVGGSHDPLAIRYEASFKDKDGVEHKSVERYYWAKMAEHFKDQETRDKIIAAPNTVKAEDFMKEIKHFDETAWNNVKLKVWEEGQRLKFDQNKWIANLLIVTHGKYVAVADQDKQIGTGWRKNMEQSDQPLLWEGKNLGGKSLMRNELGYKKTLSEEEHETAHNSAKMMKAFHWRRVMAYHGAGPEAGRGHFKGRRSQSASPNKSSRSPNVKD